VQFIDEVTIDVVAGKGGSGAVAFRRERHNPTGGPAGGDGGKGGDVVLLADPRLGTLLDLRYRPHQKAANGEGGQGNDCNGRGAEDRVVPVPVGTQAFDDETGELVCDLTRANERVVVARGGRGGRGNMSFATPWNRTPRQAEPGEAGEARRLRLLFESPGPDLLNGPDNLTVSPRGGLVVCEDPIGARARLRGIAPDGGLFDLARNHVVLDGERNGITGDFREREFAGACFSPDGRWLFANVQWPGISFAITGPWERGAL